MNDRAMPEAGGLAQPARRWLMPALLAAIAVKLALLFALAWNSRFVMDEFWQLGNAKFVFNGFFDTVQPGKAIGYAVFYKLAHLTGWNAVSTVLAGRIQTAILGCAILGMIYACARALGENRVRALAVVLVLLSFSNFMERIFRTIAEPLAVFFAVASLLAILRAKVIGPRDIVIAGVFSGLAFLATQKSIYFDVALGLALVADAAIARRYVAGVVRGAWLPLGWAIPILAYCLVFGGGHPLPVASNLLLEPFQVATRGTSEYEGLRQYVLQTLARNAIPYLFCFAGMALELARLTALDSRKRVALIFSLVITLLIFLHDQPWPYVFIMALPFMALWSLVPIDRIAADARNVRLAGALLAAGIALSFIGNVRYLRIDNAAQLDLAARAEALLAPHEHYFDGTGMLADRRESTPLWLDRHRVVLTLQEGQASEAYRGLSTDPPKMIIWSYRMDDIYPVVAPLVANSYVQVEPNIRLAGHRLSAGRPEIFDAPLAGTYLLYDPSGRPVQGELEVDGRVLNSSAQLSRGPHTVTLRTGPANALLVLQGSYAGRFAPGLDDPDLFTGVYD